MAHRSCPRRRARGGTSPGRTKSRRDAASNQASSPRKRTRAAAATDDEARGPKQHQDEDILACNSSLASRARAKDDAGGRPTRSSARIEAHTSSRPGAAAMDETTQHPKHTKSRASPPLPPGRSQARRRGAGRDSKSLATATKLSYIYSPREDLAPLTSRRRRGRRTLQKKDTSVTFWAERKKILSYI